MPPIKPDEYKQPVCSQRVDILGATPVHLYSKSSFHPTRYPISFSTQNVWAYYNSASTLRSTFRRKTM